MTVAQQIFELVDSIGEILEGDLHIIQTKYEEYSEYTNVEYRVYHNDGLCIDVSKEMDEEDEETGVAISYDYNVFQEWEGFEKRSDEQILALIQEAKLYIE